MARQLWMPQETDKRRRGTSLFELRSLVGAGITAQAILEPLQSCPANANAVEMASELGRLGFDVSGVQERSNGPVIGFVERAALREGVVRNHLRTITAGDLISEATPLHSVIALLGRRTHAFVLLGSSVGGIVTRADLNKPPVRVYLFGLVSLLEMHMNFWLSGRYPDETWKSHLSPGRIKKAEDLQVMRKTRSQETSLFDCLQFCDKKCLFVRDEILPAKLGLGAAADAKAKLNKAEALRDNLAHSQDELSLGSNWSEVIDLVAWVEAALHASDEMITPNAVEAQARQPGGA